MAEDKMGYVVICQKWLEPERGWGTRSNGYSLHLTNDDRIQYIQDYWDKMPDEVPNEYSKPDATPYPCAVNEKICKAVKNSEYGIRIYGTAPYPGGIDWWTSPCPPKLFEENISLLEIRKNTYRIQKK